MKKKPKATHEYVGHPMPRIKPPVDARLSPSLIKAWVEGFSQGVALHPDAWQWQVLKDFLLKNL